MSLNNKSKYIEDASKLTNSQKVAVLMIALGVEQASHVLKELRDDEVEKITLEIAHMDNISGNVVEEVLAEFHELIEANKFIVEGGMDFARNVLEQTRDKDQVEALLKRLENVTGNDAFGMFQENDIAQIVQFIQNENPQIAAVILAHLKLEKAAEILSHLKEDLQVEVAYRLATMNNISAEVVEEISEVMQEQMSSLYSERDNVNRGTSALADILNEASIATERAVIENISKRNSDLAEEIKNQMFMFEDILDLDDRALQLIIAAIDKGDLVLALKGADDEMIQKFTGNMSSRASDMFQEDMEATGPVHVKQVEEAQQRILKKIKELETQGQVSTRKVNSSEMIE
jgi:flagellar motor switch protein FliG